MIRSGRSADASWDPWGSWKDPTVNARCAALLSAASKGFYGVGQWHLITAHVQTPLALPASSAHLEHAHGLGALAGEQEGDGARGRLGLGWGGGGTSL